MFIVDYARQHGIKRTLSRVAQHVMSLGARAAMLPLSRSTSGDPYHKLFDRFVDEVNTLGKPKIIELGSRGRSGDLCRPRFGSAVSYLGVDVHAGPNVDLVADVHQLSQHLEAQAYDAAFSMSVFEHLAMPWKAVLELNHVLRTGGVVFVSTHPTFPAHERPWDFFRYSADGMRALFNNMTGFEIVDVCEGLPCRIVPLGFEPSMRGLQAQEAFLGVAVLARKIGPHDPRLRWDVRLDEFLSTSYPTP